MTVTHPGPHPIGADTNSVAGPILFFDGVCGLCNHAVDFVMRNDSRSRIRFAPLQGATAAELLESQDVANLNSMVMLEHGRAFRRTAAAVRILWNLGGFWNVLGWLLWVVPAPLRDVAYRLVAATRYRFFGKRETCRMPTPEERSRILP